MKPENFDMLNASSIDHQDGDESFKVQVAENASH